MIKYLFILLIVIIILLFIIFVPILTSNNKYKRKRKIKNKYKYNTKRNIYNLPLDKCEPTDLNHNDGSMLSDYTCSELDGGVHQICVKYIGKGKSFSGETGQSDWSKTRKRKNHCACLGAWANYVSKHKDKELKCSAIPDTVFNKKYINNWSNWNQVTIEDQITNGVNEMYKQCMKQAPDKDAKEYLRKRYNSISNRLSKKIKL